jgi:hypothetical protein
MYRRLALSPGQGATGNVKKPKLVNDVVAIEVFHRKVQLVERGRDHFERD